MNDLILTAICSIPPFDCEKRYRCAGIRKAMYCTRLFYLLHYFREYHDAGFGDAFRKYVQNNQFEVDIRSDCGWSPIEVAARWICRDFLYFEALKILVEAGADLNAKNAPRWASLAAVARYASNTKSIEVMEYLIQHGALMNRKGLNPSTALMAVCYGDACFEAANFLVQRNAELDYQDEDGDTALHTLSNYINQPECLKIMKLLITKGANVNLSNKKNKMPLSEVLSNPGENTKKAVKLLLSAEANVNFETINKETPLRLAFDNLEIMSQLLKKGANINYQNQDGNTVLMRVCSLPDQSNFLKTVKFLINEGANPNLLNNSKCTALSMVCFCKHLNEKEAVIDFLIKSNAEVKIFDNIGNTPLHALACNSDVTPKIIKLLVDADANVNHQNKYGSTPLIFALVNNLKMSTVKCLIDAGADINIENNRKQTPLFFVRNPESVRFLVSEKGLNVNHLDIKGVSPLIKAIRYGVNFVVIKTLIELGAEVDIINTKGYNALLTAIKYSHPDVLDIISFFVERNANIHHKNLAGENALHLACRFLVCNKLQVINLLLDLKFDINLTSNAGHAALMFAVVNSYDYIFLDFNIINLLIRRGAKINAQDNKGISALHYAVEYHREIFLMFLHDNGADINAKDTFDCNAVSRIAGNFNTLEAFEMLKLLIKRGLDVNAFDKNGDSLLIKIVDNAHNQYAIKCARILIDNGANINTKNTKGQSALFVAASRLGTEIYSGIVELLLERGAKVDDPNVEGSTPLMTIVRNGNYFSIDMAKLLLIYGADIMYQDLQGQTPLLVSMLRFEASQFYFLMLNYACVSKRVLKQIKKLNPDHCIKLNRNYLNLMLTKFRRRTLKSRITREMRIRQGQILYGYDSMNMKLICNQNNLDWTTFWFWSLTRQDILNNFSIRDFEDFKFKIPDAIKHMD